MASKRKDDVDIDDKDDAMAASLGLVGAFYGSDTMKRNENREMSQRERPSPQLIPNAATILQFGNLYFGKILRCITTDKLNIVEVIRDGGELEFYIGVSSADFPVDGYDEWI
ncbi:hypothetical protein RHMOL_Rhmol05G0130500 [Rhododendron molle]|uniref:Uncharacterized protein n=1 Tax=Rhododendron molle TaxID=49168 RepID=A0ACC0NPQ4_RHOML|nr:hypothetical protein RHMOL_Rhmol05G0130500 [Rhododendron molle]